MEFEDSYGESEEETLSLCDLPVSGSTEISAELGSSMTNSSIEFSEREDFDFDFNFGFDFDLGRSISTEFESCPADDLFSDGRILPLTQSNAQISCSKSNSFRENQILSTEKLHSWRSDSLESRSSYWTSSSSNNSQASRGNFKSSASQRRNSVHVNSSKKSESNPRRRSCTKKSLKWQQFFSVGLSKAPVMQLDDMRLRQRKSFKSRQIEKSVNGKIEETPMRAKGWMKLKNFTSLNGCMGSVKSVVNCTAAKKHIDAGNLSY